MQDNLTATFWRPEFLAKDVPKYLAIARALASDIHSGRLAPGHQLPPQRTLARQLGVDLTTVTRAFNEIRREGLVEGNTKRGTFVRAATAARFDAPIPDPSTLIDLSMNMPPQPADAFLREAIRDGIGSVLAAPHALLQLHYQDNAGALADRAAGTLFLRARLGTIPVERLIVTSGAQAALFAVASTLLAPGDVLAAPAVTYPGLRSVAARCCVRLAPLASDADGIIPAAFEELCDNKLPRALYCVPTLDNPTTATLPLNRREELIAIARRYNVAIIEDDAYGALPSQVPPPLATLAPERVWHIATLSKCATPALRVAYVTAPDVAGALQATAQTRATNMMAPPLMTGLASTWIRDGTLGRLTLAIRRENRARQAIAATALSAFDYRAHPEGHHLWLNLPEAWARPDLKADLSTDTRKAGLSVVGSEAFAVGPAPNALRISLGAAPGQAALTQGLGVLAAILSGAPRGIPGIV